MRIRAAQEGDAEKLRAYAENLFSEDLPGIYRRPAPTSEEELGFIRSHSERKNSVLLLAEEDDQVVGLIGFMGGQLEEERHVGELGVSVAKAYRGRGIGTSLIEALLEWASSHGISRLEVRSWSNNPGATRLYERMGFELEGRLREAIRRDGEAIDVYLMARLLP